MTKFRVSVLLIAVLAALTFTGCGNDITEDSSGQEGLQTWGPVVDPSAQPSVGAVVSGQPGGPAVKVPGTTGDVEGESNTQTSATPSSAPTTTPIATQRPAATPTVSEEPVISPPAPASTATRDEALAYVGKSFGSLIDALGYPSGGADYERVDEEDPNSDEIGTLYFDGFTVTTTRTADGTETVTAVN